MIVVSNSVPKCGSTLLATYQEQLLEICGKSSGQAKLKEHFGGRYIPEPTVAVLARLGEIAAIHGTVVVKNHWVLTKSIRALAEMRLVKVTMGFRDPRDIVLSAIDHGARSRRKGVLSGSFIEHRSVAESVAIVKKGLENFNAWRHLSNVFLVQYEKLMTDPVKQLSKMSEYLGWSIPESSISHIVNLQLMNREKSLNFNKGTVARWRSEMSTEDAEMSTQAFLPFLLEMGYEIEL